MSDTSRIAASTAPLAGRVLAGRLKVPKVNVNSVFCGMLAPKTNSISEEVPGFTREELINPAPACDGEITTVTGVEGRPARGCPTSVITSLEPDGTGIAGRRVMVIVTPVSDAMYLDNVICDKTC